MASGRPSPSAAIKSSETSSVQQPRFTQDQEDKSIITALAILCAAFGVVLVVGTVWLYRNRNKKHAPILDAEAIDPRNPSARGLHHAEACDPDQPTALSQQVHPPSERREQQMHWRRNWNEAEIYQLSYQRLTPPTPPPKDHDLWNHPIPLRRLSTIEETPPQVPYVPRTSVKGRPWSSKLEPISDESLAGFEEVGFMGPQSSLRPDYKSNIHPAFRDIPSRCSTNTDQGRGG